MIRYANVDEMDRRLNAGIGRWANVQMCKWDGAAEEMNR